MKRSRAAWGMMAMVTVSGCTTVIVEKEDASGGAATFAPSVGGSSILFGLGGRSTAGGTVGFVLGVGGMPAIGGIDFVGGRASVLTAGGATSSGGTTSLGGAGSIGGFSASGGTSTARTTSTPTCTADTNILGGDLGSTGNWIGGDPLSSADNPCGVQGAVHALGDGVSCKVPSADTICTNGKCSISGTTIVDVTYVAWGCSIVIDLQSEDATSSVRSLYPGPAKGFVVNTSGDLGGIGVRVLYKTNLDDTIASPFKPFTNTGPLSVTFAEAACPTGWGAGCSPVKGTGPYALMLQIIGAELATTYRLSVDSITPIL